MAMAATGDEDEAMFSAEEDFGDEEEEEEQCRICRLPAGPGRPLRRPCACRGSIRFVHDDCQLRWIVARGKPRCEVCNRGISTRLLYATDAPTRLPISEFIVGLPDKLTGLLLPLIFAVCVVPEFTIHLATLWAWRLALAGSFDQAHYLLSLRLSTASVLGLFALWVAFAHEYVPFAVAPFSHWVARLEARRQGFGGFDGLQILALFAVEAFLVVVIFDLALACVLGFLPFSLGRIVLWCILCSDSCNVGEVNSYTSTASVLLIGYVFIISVGVTYAGLNIFGQYLRGKRLVIAAFIRDLSDIFLTGITCFTSVAIFCLNTLHGVIIYPLFFGWSLDICTSKMFGATMSQRYSGQELPFPLSPIILTLTNHSTNSISRSVMIFLLGILYMAAVIFVPVQIADRLAPELFPLDITCPAESLSSWQAPQNVGDSLSRVLLLGLLIDETYVLNYPVWLVKKVTRYSFATNVVLAWLPAVIFNSSVLIFPISIGRALLSAITRLPIAGGLKSNDLLALVVGFGVIVTTIDASRDAFAYMTKGETHLRSLSQSLIVFLWSAIVPFLIGSLVDLLLIPSPTGPDDDVSLFYTWFLGYRSLRIWVTLAHQTRDTPFLAYFIDERWSPKIVRFAAGSRSGKVLLRFFLRELFMPIATRLLPALCIPYVLAKGVFPRFGYSAATNSAVYRFAWLGTLGPCALCYISKLLCAKLHDSIRDERYVIGQRLEDVAEGS